MTSNTYDAIVIGSGISGGWAAKELTEKGLKVVMLERGKNVEHIKDYTSTDKGTWEFPHRGARTQQMIKDYPVLSRDYPLNEKNLDWWASDQDNPYTEAKRFDWYRAYIVGGRSLLWGRMSLRLGDLDFEANAKEGIAIDWPIRYKEIAPWYTYVEKYAGISGSRDGFPSLPDGYYMPPMEMNCVEKDFAQKIKKLYGTERMVTHGRTANITQPHTPGRLNCQYRDKCWLGCNFGAYFSTQSSTLPAAMATQNLTLRPHSIVTKILYDPKKRRATGVEMIDALDHKVYEYKAKLVFVCASTLNSTWILMNSATDIWEGGLGSSSGALGHNLMDHTFRCGARAETDQFSDKRVYGKKPVGFYIPRFRNVFSKEEHYTRGFGYHGAAYRSAGTEAAQTALGAELKAHLLQLGNWRIRMNAFGEILPYHDNRVFLDHSKKDKWGLPVLAVDAEIKDNEKKMRVAMMNDGAEMLEKAGYKHVETFDDGYAMGQCIHEMGTARMGHQPTSSVLNKFNQVWDAPNVFVTDGACMVSSSAVNPSLTYMALTARAADHAVSELKKGNL